MFKKKLSDDNIIASKELSSEDYNNWPFTVNSVILQKRGVLLLGGEIKESMIYITLLINGKVFGLNGASVDHLKLKSILNSKYYVKGLQVTEFIEIGFNLKR